MSQRILEIYLHVDGIGIIERVLLMAVLYHCRGACNIADREIDTSMKTHVSPLEAPSIEERSYTKLCLLYGYTDPVVIGCTPLSSGRRTVHREMVCQRSYRTLL